MIPQWVQRKAQAVSEKLAAGELRPRVLRLTRKRWLVVDLSKRWRFMSADGVNWRVESHETYSKLTSMHRNV